jgi:hypothetical protein
MTCESGTVRVSLTGRAQPQDVLTRIAGQTLVHPIRHGARVLLPPEEAGQGRLF